ncbi:microsomal glutathione S-transferase 1 [Aedes aegypti]|uniref:Microsomal glutathione S-transferase 1 n=1 Tax=Aedes aegypti TaxID=7159 RepID=A0A6I8TDK4_AEDAE|nr:microsomal glutathione S-transferase 1 [Aedes aegypti]
MSNLLDQVNPELLRTYAFWSVILVAKMLLMSLFTTMTRIRKMAFINPEDVKSISPKLKPKVDDPDVERVRRAHRNDLENILPFFVVAFLYLLTNPDPWLATQLIRAAAAGRIVHSLVYAVMPVPQPARLFSFGVTLLVTVYMIVQCALYFM